MKKIYALLFLIITITISAQAPQGFNYQATVRNNAGALIINKSVSFKFNIIPTSASGTAVYSESQTVTTDDVGQVSLVIGKGIPNTGTFATIDWSTGTYFLGIELNTGNGFVAMGTTQLLSVPYALYAKNSGNAIAPGTANGQILYWNGTSWVTLNPGANGTNLKLNNGLPVWENSVGSISSGTATGQLLYWNGTAWVTLDPGTDGDVLRVANGIPTFSKTIPKLTITDYLLSYESDNTIRLGMKPDILDTGGGKIFKKGIALSITNNLPTIADDFINYTGEYYLFSFGGMLEQDRTYYEIENLQPNTTYYIRTYAENEIGIAYSNLLTFVTPSSQFITISLSKPIITDIKTSSSIVESKLQPINHLVSNPNEINEIGFVVSKTQSPTIENSEKFLSDYSVKQITLNNLDPNTTYYVKSFLTNSNGTSYSEQSTFTTLPPSTPVLSKLYKSNPDQISITLYASYLDEGGSPISQKGFVWSTSTNPTIALNTKIFDPSVQSSFNKTIVGLLPDTNYSVRAFATNTNGTSYSREISFKTLPLLAPKLDLPSISNPTQNSIGFYCSFNNGGSSITQKGIVWSTSPNPTTALTTKSIDTNSGSSISKSITGLSAATTYYVRAFATNALGTSYSKEKTFTTMELSAPIISSISPTAILSLTQTSASASTTINSDGGSAITQKGFIWSTSPNLTTALTTKSISTASGNSISSSITGLSPATMYYLSAFATNSQGTSYSLETTFTTSP